MTKLLATFALALMATTVCAAPLPAVVPRSIQVDDVQGGPVEPLQVPDRVATVLIFIAHDCPISNAYSAEIARLRTDYGPSHIGFYVVYTDTGVPASTLIGHARAHGYSKFALLDPAHKLVKLVGARVTPEAVVLGQSDHVLYEGRIDNRFTGFGLARDVASVGDLRRALDSIRLGKPIAVARTQAVGCYIPGV